MAAPKPPRPFRKPLSEKRYRKRLRSRIYLDTDRRFLDSITTTDDEGRIVLARKPSKDEVKRLKKLAKEAKKNRGAVRTGKLVILLVLVASVLVFNLLFKDRLVEEGAESLLESIFRAQADLSGVNVRLLAGDVRFASLDVADAREPQTNLFSLGEGRFDLDTWQLLAGKVVINNLSVTGLAFATPRESSGALEVDEEAATAAAGAPAVGTPPVDDLSFASLGLPDTLDAQAFVEEQLDLLETPARVEELAGTGTAFVTTWRGEIEDLAGAGLDSADRIRELSQTDFTAIRSVDEALLLLEESNAVVESASAYVDRVETAVDDVRTEARSIASSAAEVPELVRADYGRVREQIPDVRAEGRDFLVGLIEPYVEQRLGEWYGRILFAWDLLGRLRSSEEAPRERRGRRAGRVVDFATAEYPRFELQRAFLSSAGDAARELTLEMVSSDPDLTGAPTRLMYAGTRGESSLGIGAVLDGRSSSETPVSLTATARGQAVSVDRGLAALDLERFDALADVELSFLRRADRTSSGEVRVGASAITLTGAPEPGSIGELVREVLTGSPLDGTFAYRVDSDGSLRLSDGATNLDERIAGVVQDRIDATLASFAGRVEVELDARIAPYLERLDDSLAEVIDARETAEELLALATDREAAAVALQQRAATALDSLREAVEAEARARVEEARQAAEDAAREQAERAEAAAREEAERAAGEAEDAVRDRVDDVRSRLPGF
ncbi:MAG: hypothetical protein ACOCYX_03320 [Spirochaetota bacterium]